VAHTVGRSGIVLSESVVEAYFFTIKIRMPFDDMRVFCEPEFDSGKFLPRGI